MKVLVVTVALLCGLTACDSGQPKQKTEIDPVLLVEKVIERYPGNTVKAIEEYQMVDGVQKIYGYKEFYPSGKVKIEGRYNEDHQRTGLWQAYFENGQFWSVGNYINGEENGEKKVWYENGKIRYTGEMKNNKPIGEWHVWDESGVVTTKEFK